MRSVWRIGGIVLIALGVAVVANAAHPKGIRWFVAREAIYPQPNQEQQAAAISREEVVAMLEQGGLVLDARKQDLFAKGHIPGAVSIPIEEPAGRTLLATMADLALPEDPIVVYCGGDECDESLMLFEQLRQMGYGQARIYLAGWRDWIEHDMPIER